MPKLMGTSDTQTHNTISGFQFSAAPVDSLGATEYTIVTIVLDHSGSVYSYKKDLEEMMKTVVGACKKSPRADNLLLRVVTFDTDVEEVIGFVELSKVNPDDFDGSLSPDGYTSLRDATLNCLEATQKYAEELDAMDYMSNAVMYVISDGADNSSHIATHAKIKNAVDVMRKKEVLESLMVVVIGVGDSPVLKKYQEEFSTQSGLDHFLPIGEATASNLAKLGGFISQSISSSSQALGTGGPSPQLSGRLLEF